MTGRDRAGAEGSGRGPEAFHATALWLRGAHSELRWDVHDAVQDGELVVLHTTMSGRQTGAFTAYGEDASVVVVFPPTGRRFSVTQTHWFRMRDGTVVEHRANRDDRLMGEQLGWTPPSAVYLVKMVLARRQARRDAARSGEEGRSAGHPVSDRTSATSYSATDAAAWSILRHFSLVLETDLGGSSLRNDTATS